MKWVDYLGAKSGGFDFTSDEAFATKSSAKLDKDLIALYSLPFQLFPFLIGQATIKFMKDKNLCEKL